MSPSSLLPYTTIGMGRKENTSLPSFLGGKVFWGSSEAGTPKEAGFRKKFFFGLSEFFFRKFLENFRFEKLSENFKATTFPKNPMLQARSLVEGRHLVVLFLLRPKDGKKRNPIYIEIYIYIYIYIYIKVFAGSAPEKTKKNKNKRFFLKKNRQKGLSFFQKKMFFFNTSFCRKIDISAKTPFFHLGKNPFFHSSILKLPHSATIF